MARISVRVLDCAFGNPAEGVTLQLKRMSEQNWTTIVTGRTGAGGRMEKLETFPAARGNHQLTIGMSAYFAELGTRAECLDAVIGFRIGHPDLHMHVEICISPVGLAASWKHHWLDGEFDE